MSKAKIDLDFVLKCIEAEPELEDEMPNEMWKFISESKENATLAFRTIVSLSKEGIKNRILEAQDEQG